MAYNPQTRLTIECIMGCLQKWAPQRLYEFNGQLLEDSAQICAGD